MGRQPDLTGSRIKLPFTVEYSVEYKPELINDGVNFGAVIRPQVKLLGAKVDYNEEDVIKNALGKMLRDSLGRYKSLRRKGTLL